MKHKWHDEIVAWAGGQKVEEFAYGVWEERDQPRWHLNYQYRIKPQPKQPKYLYAYFDLLTGAVVFNTTTQWSNANKNLELIGKIEVQDD